MSRLSFFAAVFLLALTDATSAQAACLAAEPALVWSLPADGDVDVPANAKLWVLTTSFGQFSVEVDGVVVERDAEMPMFTPGELSPGEHVVELSFVDDAGERRVFDTFVFTSNATTTVAESDPPALSSLDLRADRDFSETCAAAFASMDCFDQGQDTHYVVETSAADGFLVTSFFKENDAFPNGPRALWPGECGRPEAFLSGGKPDKCIDVATISLGGVSPSSRICDGDVSCSQAGAPKLFASVALFLCVLRRRRR